MNPTIKYLHFDVVESFRGFGDVIGNITAAYTTNIDPVMNIEQIKVGFSYCSPKEKGFCKRTGREIAEKMLIDNPQSFIMDNVRRVEDKWYKKIKIGKEAVEFAHSKNIGWMRKFNEWDIWFRNGNPIID